MIQIISGDFRKQARYFIPSNGTSPARWRTDFIGDHGTRTGRIEDRPQAFLAEMDANSSILPHFHQIDQFQVLLSGSGSLGGKPAALLAVRYADHHTPCDRIDAGPFGLTLFTLRAKADPGALHMHKPEYQHLLKATKKRYLEVGNIAISTEPVLQNRGDPSIEDVLRAGDTSDGLGAYMLRLGAGMKTMAPNPATTGGQYQLVVNGSLQYESVDYPLWTVMYAAPGDASPEVRAGPAGLEMLVLNFPRTDA